MQNISKTIILISLILVILSGITLGQVPHLINYQGVLIDPSTGQPIPNETHSIKFSIYDVPTGGSADWSETHSVETKNGLYSVQLGLNTPLTIDDLSGTEKYLGIKVDEDPEMTPRKRIVSVAYAIMCEESLNSWNLTGNSGTTAGTNFLGTTDNQPLIFKTNEVEALRINTDGNIGLGTTTPSYKLHVTGSVSGPLVHFGNFLHTGTSLQLSVADQNTPTALTMYTTNAAGSESGVSIDFKGAKVGGTGFNAARISGFLTDPSTAIDGAVTIQTLGGGTLSERVRFQGNGNVGIGITNPSSKLQVAGIIHSSAGGFKFPDGTTQTTAATGGSGGGWTDGGTNVYLTTSTDKVGIGDTSPTHKLDVAGKIGINDTQVLFLPEQGDFTGTLILGNGGGSLSHSSGNDGCYNTGIGIRALNSNTTGYMNTASGVSALYSNTTGFHNTSSGYGALYANTEGSYNTASGYGALAANTTGSNNAASGYGALAANTTGGNNTAIGFQANYFNRTGSNNTIIGYQAGHGTAEHNKSGNIFIGYQAGYNEIGDNKLYIENSNSDSPLIGGDFSTDELYLNANVGIGTSSPGAELDVAGKIKTSQLQVGTATTAGYVLTADASGNATWQAASGGGGGWTDGGTNVYLTTSTDNVGIGDTSPTHKLDVAGKIGINDTQMLYLPDQTDFTGTLILGDGGGSLNHSSGDDGRHNTAIGIGSLNANTTGYSNTASGYGALYSNSTGYMNTASGYYALYANTSGGFNTASGFLALSNNNIGYSNTANGYAALNNNITGYNNTASGEFALKSNTTGNSNVGIGCGANYYNRTGSNNTIIGYQAGYGASAHDKSGNVFIGYQAGYNETGDNKLYIENSNSDTPLIGGDFSTDELYLNANVGIGTSSPGAELDVAGKIKTTQLQVGTSTTAGYVLTADASGNATWQAGGGGGNTLDQAYDQGGPGAGKTITADAGAVNIAGSDGLTVNGNVGIGTTSPLYKLHVNGTNEAGYFEASGSYGRGVSASVDGIEGWAVDARASGNSGRGVYGWASKTGEVENYGGYFVASGNYGRGVYAKASGTAGYAGYFEASGVNATGIYAKASANGNAAEFEGNLIIRKLGTGETLMELGEGLDYAEGFDVTDEKQIEPGSVLIIDPDHLGKLALSDKPYDSKVAGIVSGAKGLGSGVRLGSEQFDYDVALAGRVYCNVDATEAAVEPGDLLTTSGTPGYAMKATNYVQAQGAILGKAMERMEKGNKGQILVLVTLQ